MKDDGYKNGKKSCINVIINIDTTSEYRSTGDFWFCSEVSKKFESQTKYDSVYLFITCGGSFRKPHFMKTFFHYSLVKVRVLLFALTWIADIYKDGTTIHSAFAISMGWQREICFI